MVVCKVHEGRGPWGFNPWHTSVKLF